MAAVVPAFREGPDGCGELADALEGSSGVSDAGMQAAIAAGMTKINVATHLNQVFTGSVRESLVADLTMVDSRKWMKPARTAVEQETYRLLSLYARMIRQKSGPN